MPGSVTYRPSLLQQNLPIIVQILMASAARKDKQAKDFYDALPGGVTAADFQEGGQFAKNSGKLKRYGIDVKKLPATTVLKPETLSDVVNRFASMAGKKMPPDQQVAAGTRAITSATGGPGITPEAAASATRTGETTARTAETLAGAASRGVNELPPDQQAALGQKVTLGTTAGEAAGAEAAGQTQAVLQPIVSRSVQAMLSDPGLNSIVQSLGLNNVETAVGMAATGLNGLTNTLGQLAVGSQQGQQQYALELAKARLAVAKGLTEEWKSVLPMSVDEAMALLNGDEEFLKTPKGQQAASLYAAATQAWMADRAVKGSVPLQMTMQFWPVLLRQYGSDTDLLKGMTDLTNKVIQRELGTDQNILPLFQSPGWWSRMFHIGRNIKPMFEGAGGQPGPTPGEIPADATRQGQPPELQGVDPEAMQALMQMFYQLLGQGGGRLDSLLTPAPGR